MPNEFGEYQTGDVFVDGKWASPPTNISQGFGEYQTFVPPTNIGILGVSSPQGVELYNGLDPNWARHWQEYYSNYAAQNPNLANIPITQNVSNAETGLSARNPAYGYTPNQLASWNFYNTPESMTAYRADQGFGTSVANRQHEMNPGDDGFGGLGGLLGGMAGIALAPFTGGSSLMMGALGGGLGSAVTGGNPLTGAALGALGGWGWDALGGMSALGGAGEAAMAPVNYSLTAGGVPSLSTYGATGLAGTGAPMLSTYGAGGLAGTGFSSLGSLAGLGGITGTAMAGTDWLSSLAGNVGKDYLKNQVKSNLFGTPGGTQTGARNMALGDMTLGQAGSALSPFLSALNTYGNIGSTEEAYRRANELITTPSADQQKYRAMLSSLMESPGSMTSSPLYQALADQGISAVNRTAAAKGMLGSGNRLTDLMKVGEQTAAQYYFPQQQALAQLSGVSGDQAARALAAQGLLGGNQATMGLQTRMLKDLLSGVGVQSPEQQLVNALMGGGGSAGGSVGIGGTTLGQIGNSIYDWFGNNASSPTDYSNWGVLSDFGQYTPSFDYSQYLTPTDYTSNLFDISQYL